MAAAGLDPTARWCPVCGVRGCALAHIPQAHRWRLRLLMTRLLRRGRRG